MTMPIDRFSLVLHGGAGSAPGKSYSCEISHMRSVVEAGRNQLAKGANALDVAVDVVSMLEASGLYIAGKGGSPNTLGAYELDACVMDGNSGRAGSVAALQGFESPILAARAVMRHTPHVMLVGEGAATFAKAQGLKAIDDPADWFTHAGSDEANYAPPMPTGTVGCAVRDSKGRLAAATSTAGVFGKQPGRVGDGPLVGAGTWADDRIAVSCTGQGELFIRTAVAVQVAHRIRFGRESIEMAAAAAIRGVADLGGDGGLIAVDRDGNIAMPFASSGLKRAALLPDGTIMSAAF
jgi:isoaspartyl peptidase/L-asparaginase-like protein (Ntn-hydrolase superfamily)